MLLFVLIQLKSKRMALSFLLGFQGLSSQRTLHKSGLSDHSDKFGSCMALRECDVKILVEVLSNALHGRGKAGPGGYKASTFTSKSVLRCLRCMLTHIENRKMLATLVGPQLNTLLINIVAVYSLNIPKPMVDEEDAANSICVLYELSKYSSLGLPVLPRSFADQTESEGDRSTAAGKATKILVAYLYRGPATTASRHAAEQLLMKIPHLTFGKEMNGINREVLSLNPKDLGLHQTVQCRLDEVPLPNLKRSKPAKNGIFDRPIVCVSPLQNNKGSDDSSEVSWSNARRNERASFVDGFSIFGFECCAVDTTATTRTT